MASYSQPPSFSSLIPINNKTLAFSQQPKIFLTFKHSKISATKAESSSNFQENSPPDEADPVKLAFAKARAYKKSNESGIQTPNIVQSPPQEPYADVTEQYDGDDDDDVEKEVPLAVKLALEKANEYKEGKALADNEGVVSRITPNLGIDKDDDGEEKEISLAVKLAMEKAKEYKKNKGVVDSSDIKGVSGLKGGDEKSGGNKQSINSSGKKDEMRISSIDFMGLGFADKKSGRDLPAGLVPLSDPFPEGELPEVEILVGDSSKFDDTMLNATPSKESENDDDLYKPKVSTWGVFPRPTDISKTYGGGRTLRPGEALETTEERASKEARTKQLVAAYKTKIGLNIDPKLKSECEKVLEEGDSLMDLGKLKEALLFYERVMDKLPFQTEVHGLAALQWSICQDSLTRHNEARAMYEKLQSHPNPKVGKRARQFFFSFKAMEMMKVTSMDRSPRTTGYQNYFDEFVKDKTNYTFNEAEEDEGGLNQALPYVIFLASPFLMVLLIAASRSL